MKHDLHCSAQVLGEKQQRVAKIIADYVAVVYALYFECVNASVIIFLALNLLCEVFFFLRDSMEHHHLAGVVSSSHSNGKWGIKHLFALF